MLYFLTRITNFIESIPRYIFKALGKILGAFDKVWILKHIPLGIRVFCVVMMFVLFAKVAFDTGNPIWSVFWLYCITALAAYGYEPTEDWHYKLWRKIAGLFKGKSF